ncbi:hypothetical protein PITC_009070 [Penicillium italicum]|uniref:DUF5872 domain-containing protein n=1 Tax=Penicillium italicum TaxID=40296 RepID=A0A0A2KKN3_PENIT|nr:hypothetical protein PITC_009070 [Penicillium italicum]
MPPKDKYSDPELRDEIKKEVRGCDKGGKPGQWSARKAQMMASEYKRRGGSYNTTKEEGQTESQKHLDTWTKEKWQTKEGSGTARQGNDSRKRYLPKKAWEKLCEEEKEQTEEKKIEESQGGKQFVGNTKEAKEARWKVSSDIRDEGQKVEGNSEKFRGNGETDKKRTKKNEEEIADDEQNDNQQNDDQQNDDQQNDDQQSDDQQKDEQNDENQKNDKKRGAGKKRSAKQDEAPKKKARDSVRMQGLRNRK